MKYVIYNSAIKTVKKYITTRLALVFWGSLGLVYVLTRLPFLTRLPVFADEAIYIYWAQLAASDWSRYSFYPLNDGKTPLFIWLLIPLLSVIPDPLFAGRLLSVIFGWVAVYATVKITQLFTPRYRYAWLSGMLLIMAPGFILNNRLALMDTASTAYLLLSFYYTCRVLRQIARRHSLLPLTGSLLIQLMAAGVFFGLALLNKLSNILFVPVLVLTPIFFVAVTAWRSRATRHLEVQSLFHQLIAIGVIGLVGGCLFLPLKWQPAFSQLFARGGDFLYPLHEFFAHPLQILWTNARRFVQILRYYSGTVLLIVSLLVPALVWSRDRRPAKIIALGFVFLLPMMLWGKIVYPRYLLPVLPFLAIGASLALSRWRPRFNFVTKNILLLIIFVGGIYFSVVGFIQPARLHLDPADRQQLLDEWSAGYGIKQTVALIKKLAADQPLLILTEGHIGTLPDGLQIYFWRDADRDKLRIEGIGQPVKKLDADTLSLMRDYPQAILVVNSHRFQPEPEFPTVTLLAEYPRPSKDAPTLQVYSLDY